jgi:hypothetical protein
MVSLFDERPAKGGIFRLAQEQVDLLAQAAKDHRLLSGAVGDQAEGGSHQLARLIGPRDHAQLPLIVEAVPATTASRIRSRPACCAGTQK